MGELLKLLQEWMKDKENEHLEFKEAKVRYDFEVTLTCPNVGCACCLSLSHGALLLGGAGLGSLGLPVG
jgi:hypothetical protein